MYFFTHCDPSGLAYITFICNIFLSNFKYLIFRVSGYVVEGLAIPSFPWLVYKQGGSKVTYL